MADKEKIFENIVKDYEKSECFSARLCPDQYVGKIADFKNEKKEVKEDFPVRVNIFAGQTADVCIKFSSYEKIMILILESPHQDEFDKNGNPIGPACSTTGLHIRKYICDIFGNGYKGYHLVLMNAIPFQCSLGLSLNNNKQNLNRRDNLFEKIWHKDENIFKNFFVNRLTILTELFKSKPGNFVIANCCTKGYSEKSPLYQYVSEAIDTTGLKYIQLDHPAIIWNTKKARERLREKVKSAGLYKEKASEK